MLFPIRNWFSPASAVFLAAAGSIPARAQDTALAAKLPAVVVTRDAKRSALELPYAITTTTLEQRVPGITRTQADQVLAFIPGLTLANRGNPSQDPRLSIRGFGARSAFGVRSMRVMRDGMPLTLPDGQTPIDYLDLEGVGRVETIRGTASALYGNASGGVIDLRSAPPPSARLGVQARSWAGSNGLQRYVGLFGGTIGSAAYQGNIGRLKSDGVRAYANQELTNAFTRASIDVRGTELSLTGLGLDMPIAQNPGALTRVQFDTNPEMADPLSISKRARKAVHQVQIGLGAHRELSERGDVQAQIYGGTRSLFNPLTFAVVGVDRHSSGASLRGTIAVDALGVTHRVTAGVDAQRLSDARKNWANCNAVATATANCPTVGVERGVLQLDQREVVTSAGPYVRDEVGFGKVLASLGARYDNTRFELRDAFLSDGRDDSGVRTMRAVSPMGALSFRMTPNIVWYASWSSAFETPTTTELGNQQNGSAGLNTTLQPQYSTTGELGAKGFALSNGRLRYDFATFTTSVRDELIPFDIGSGRTAYRNAGRTRRRGVELSSDGDVGPLTLAATFTFSDFRFGNYVSGTTQLSGRRIPGIPERQAQTSVTWHLPHAFIVSEWQAKSHVYVNDANAAKAPGYAVVNLRAGAAMPKRPWLAPVFGVSNLLDRKHVGSVAVNAAGTVTSGKFYEPGPGRTWFFGLSAATAR